MNANSIYDLCNKEFVDSYGQMRSPAKNRNNRVLPAAIIIAANGGTPDIGADFGAIRLQPFNVSTEEDGTITGDWILYVEQGCYHATTEFGQVVDSRFIGNN